MSIDLELKLQEVGFPTDPRQIVGRLYQFECQHGSHYGILVGTVQAVEISDEGGIDLYVSNPRFWGVRLTSIKYSNGKWMVYLSGFASRVFEGKLQLL